MTRPLTKLVLILTIILKFSLSYGQDFPSYIKENAIPINKQQNFNDSVYKLLSDFQIIMVGEMHGTNEPANFLISLIKLYARIGDSIQVGLEIPSEEMTKYLTEHSDSSVYLSDFFTKTTIDGRESTSWAEIIVTANKIKNIRVFFFDENTEDKKISNNRDSLMYVKIKGQMQKNPKWKTITLSGNIHNMLLPYRETNTMAYYLNTDKELKLTDKICSINHRYKSGEMFNNGGNGIELRQVKSPDSDFSTTVDYDCYLLLLPKYKVDKYNGIYFTRNVTASKMVRNK